MAERWVASQSGQRYPRSAQEMQHELEHEHGRRPLSPYNNRARVSRAMQPSLDEVEERAGTFRSGNERLYEAYNDLHALAQDFEKPFDAPAILVVGHQTDGKSGMDGQGRVLYCAIETVERASGLAAVHLLD